MPGVVVSDGLHVTRTGPDGGFSLPGYGPFVVCARPTGFAVDPWFARAGDEPLEFRMVPQVQELPFSFIQVTDLHVALGDRSFGPGAGDATFWFADGRWNERVVTTPDVLAGLFEEIGERHPDGAFIVATGDLTNSGAREQYEAYVAEAARSRVPVVSLAGNHDHMPSAQDPGAAEAESPNFTAVTERYERYVGPRWFSFDYAGVHFVAIDWFTHRLGIDADVQEAWLDADLAMVEPETPVVLLAHDQMPSDFFGRMRVAPIASFSGHWHTTRVVSDGGTVHYNTGPATFGGLDFCPRHYRVAEWDGTELRVQTTARGPAFLRGATFRSAPLPLTDGPAWARALDGAAHLAAPVVVGDMVIATSRQEDRAAGAVEAFDAITGEPRWRARLSSAVKSSPLVCGDAVVATSVAGEIVCLAAVDGSERWRVRLADAMLLWAYLRPATDGKRVFVGDVGRFACLDLRDGSIIWARDDLGKRENMTSFAHPVVVGGTLIVGFAAQVPDMYGLDPETGATLWPHGVRARSVYEGSMAEIVAHLPRSLVGGITPDPDGADAYVVRLGSVVERVRCVDGSSVWAAPILGWFNPAPPVVCGDAVFVVAGTGEVSCLDRSDGALRWNVSVSQSAPVAMGPYRDTGAVALAPVTVVAGRAWVPLGDGRLVGLRVDDGVIDEVRDFAVPLTSALACAGGVAYVVGVDGVLRAFRL